MKKQKQKRFLTIFIILILISMSAIIYGTTTIISDPIEITLQDKNLYEALKLYFDAKDMKHENDETTQTITASIEEVNLVQDLTLKGSDGAKISNISGLEKFTNLKKINLADNNIVDITPILTLTSVTSIDLSNNINLNLNPSGTYHLPNQGNLEELYISSTKNSDIDFINYNNFPKLKVLDISNNGISSVSSLATLVNLEILDVSENRAVTTIDNILQIVNLTELDIGSTGITSLLHSQYEYESYEHGIFKLKKLEKLNVENNQLSIDPILKTYYDEEKGVDKAHLENLVQLNFNYTGQEYVDYTSLALLSNLTHLYMKGNGISSVDSDIALLENLDYIDLSENYIEDISGFIRYDDEGKIEKTLHAQQIILAHNYIQDVEPLGNLQGDITYLDLSSNVVFYIDPIDFNRFSFSKGLDLSRQGRDKYDEEGNEEYIWYMSIKDKKAKKNQYIFLPTLFQNSKMATSIVYHDNIEFEYENITLNSDTKYHEPGLYNVVIEPLEKNDDGEYEEKILSITLKGGCANDSQLHFRIEDNYESIDSMLFKDENLANAIENELRPRAIAEDLYIYSGLDILNITSTLVEETTTLHLENKEISYLDGLSSFENLLYLYLSNNNISSLDEIQYCEEMLELYVSNNPNIGNNNSAIENMLNLIKLDLSNTGMTNIQSIQNLISKWKTEEMEIPLTYLSLSNNTLENIQDIGDITALKELYLSKVGLTNINEITTLKKLTTLNISINEIEDISILQGLTRLKYLNMSSNNIQDITPIANIALDNLNFADNKVKDVSSLTRGYTTLKMDTNQISNVSSFDNKIIENFSVTNQKIVSTINSKEDVDVTIELPDIFKAAKKSSSKVYSENAFVVTNCTLSDDGLSVRVNPKQLDGKIATVKINGGNANMTTLYIAAPIIGRITYTPDNITPTKQDIVATITFGRDNVRITNNDGKNTYTFTKNGTFVFEYEDEYGFVGSTEAVVSNIDREKPQVTEIIKEIINKTVKVTIKVNEEIVPINGWTLVENDSLSISKIYSEDANETITITDLVGNTENITISVDIDNEPPVISGVENGQTYQRVVTPSIQDDNLDTVVLIKDEEKQEDYELGDTITEKGNYTLTATDTFGNTTTIAFVMEEISDIITSTTLNVNEETLVIKGIQPKTNIQQLKDNLTNEMDYEVIDEEGNIVSDTSSFVGTGYQIKMANNKKYDIVVWGDLNSDGQVKLSDLSKLKLVVIGTNTLEGVYKEAADVKPDGNIKLSDLSKLKLYIVRGN